MSNSSAVVFVSKNANGSDKEVSPIVRLNWNGGAESIYAFLDALRTLAPQSVKYPHFAALEFARIAANTLGGPLGVSLYNAPERLPSVDLDTNHGLFVVTDGVVVRRLSAAGRLMENEEAEAERKVALAHEYRVPGADCLDTDITEANQDFFNIPTKKTA